MTYAAREGAQGRGHKAGGAREGAQRVLLSALHLALINVAIFEVAFTIRVGCTGLQGAHVEHAEAVSVGSIGASGAVHSTPENDCQAWRERRSARAYQSRRFFCSPGNEMVANTNGVLPDGFAARRWYLRKMLQKYNEGRT